MDVNVHPTKHEVIMLHQEEITQALCDALQQLHSGQLQWVSPSCDLRLVLTPHSWRASWDSYATYQVLNVVLTDERSPRRCSCSHAISARAGSAAAAPQKPHVGTGYRPESLVRTDRHTQKLHNFFMPSSQAPSSSRSLAVATPQGAGHREGSVTETKPVDSSTVQREVLPSAEGSGQDGHRESKRPRLLEETAGALAAAAAREKLQLEAHSGTQLPGLAVDILSSAFHLPCGGQQFAWALAHLADNPASSFELHRAGLRQRLQHFVLVGQIDGQSMLVQEGLDLILVDTSALAHDLFYQLVCSSTNLTPSVLHSLLA